MRYRLLLFFTFLFALSSASVAQEKKGIGVYPSQEPDERGSSRVLYWNDASNTSAGEFVVDFGRPLWKKDYENTATFDAMTKGKVWRLGKDFWTVFDTNIPIRIAGKDIAVGAYYIGLHRSEDGSKWSLAFMHPDKIRNTRLDAFEIAKAPVSFTAPMSLQQADALTEKLTISFSQPKKDSKNVTMKIAWGKLNLSTPIEVVLGR